MKDKTMEEFVLENQINAFTRVLSLFPDNSMTYDDVFNALAKAEEEAQFVCGFIDLNQHLNEKLVVLQKAIEQGLVTKNGHDNLSLTVKGVERARIELPKQIEDCIRNK